MTYHVDAIYDNGVLKPLVPLDLPDGCRVHLTIELIVDENQSSEFYGHGSDP